MIFSVYMCLLVAYQTSYEVTPRECGQSDPRSSTKKLPFSLPLYSASYLLQAEMSGTSYSPSCTSFQKG